MLDNSENTITDLILTGYNIYFIGDNKGDVIGVKSSENEDGVHYTPIFSRESFAIDFIKKNNFDGATVQCGHIFPNGEVLAGSSASKFAIKHNIKLKMIKQNDA